jgi:hypothetical protein
MQAAGRSFFGRSGSSGLELGYKPDFLIYIYIYINLTTYVVKLDFRVSGVCLQVDPIR